MKSPLQTGRGGGGGALTGEQCECDTNARADGRLAFASGDSSLCAFDARMLLRPCRAAPGFDDDLCRSYWWAAAREPRVHDCRAQTLCRACGSWTRTRTGRTWQSLSNRRQHRVLRSAPSPPRHLHIRNKVSAEKLVRGRHRLSRRRSADFRQRAHGRYHRVAVRRLWGYGGDDCTRRKWHCRVGTKARRVADCEVRTANDPMKISPAAGGLPQVHGEGRWRRGACVVRASGRRIAGEIEDQRDAWRVRICTRSASAIIAVESKSAKLWRGVSRSAAARRGGSSPARPQPATRPIEERSRGAERRQMLGDSWGRSRAPLVPQRRAWLYAKCVRFDAP